MAGRTAVRVTNALDLRLRAERFKKVGSLATRRQ
jgi:hypothetical protein